MPQEAPNPQSRLGSSAPAEKRGRAADCIAPILLLLGLGLPTLLYPFGRDQAMFAYVGRVWREGGLPYRDAWDVKLPAIYAVYALVGAAEWGPRLLDLAAAAAAAAGLALLVGRSGGWGVAPGAVAGTGALAAGIALLYTLGALDYWNLAQAETLIAPLSVWAMVLALSGRPLAAGALAGCAACFKTPAALFLLPVLAVLPAGGSDRRRAWGLALSGWLLPPALAGAYFALRGGLPHLGELLAAQAEYAGGDPRLAGRPVGQLVRELGLQGYLPLAAASAAALPALLAAGSGARGTRAAALWWLAALAQVLMQKRFYLYHWAVLTPPAAWLAAEGLARLWTGRSGLRGTPIPRPLLAIACLGLAWMAAGPRLSGAGRAAAAIGERDGVRAYRRSFTGVFAFSAAGVMDAGEYLRARTGPRETIQVLAFEPAIYLHSGRMAASRHASDAPLFGETAIGERRRRRWLAELLADMRRAPPRYVVRPERMTQPPAWAASLEGLLQREYVLETVLAGYRFYRRRPGTGAPGERPAAVDTRPGGG